MKQTNIKLEVGTAKIIRDMIRAYRELPEANKELTDDIIMTITGAIYDAEHKKINTRGYKIDL